MSLLDQRNSDLGVIEGRFIRQVLNDQAKEILADSKRVQRANNFTNPKWNNVSMVVDNQTLTYSQIAPLRFVDMKTRRVKGHTVGNRKVPKGKIRKKNFPVHNKPIMSHKRFIIRMLSFGFTKEVIQNFRDLEAQNK